MKILLDLQNSMRAVTLNSEFSLCGLIAMIHILMLLAHVLHCNVYSYHRKSAVKQSLAKEWKRFSLKRMIHFLFLLLLCKSSTIIIKNISYMCALTYGLLLCRYLLNPYTILTCGGLSTILLVNLAIVWSLWMRLRGNL